MKYTPAKPNLEIRMPHLGTMAYGTFEKPEGYGQKSNTHSERVPG